MYITQSTFVGKTGPIDPIRQLLPNRPLNERTYPNKWMEDRNLRTMHRKPFTPKLNSELGQGMLLNIAN